MQHTVPGDHLCTAVLHPLLTIPQYYSISIDTDSYKPALHNFNAQCQMVSQLVGIQGFIRYILDVENEADSRPFIPFC